MYCQDCSQDGPTTIHDGWHVCACGAHIDTVDAVTRAEGWVKPSDDTWTAVTDQLPEEDQEVIVCTDIADVTCGWWTPGGWTVLGPKGEDSQVVIYWRPLPEAM